MRVTTARCLGAGGTVILGLLGWLIFKPAPPSDAPAASKRAPVAPPVPSLKSPSAKPAEAWPEFGTPEFKAMALQRGEKWLASRGRDAASLVAAWDITGEESLLDEAAEKFPNDPRVCMAMIARLRDSAEAAMPWIERLIAAEPLNPEGQYLKAWALRKQGDKAAAMEALRTALTMPTKRDSHLRDRILTVREAALASGAGIREAATIALSGPLQKAPLYQIASTPILIAHELKAAKAAGDQERVLELAGLGLASVARINEEPWLIGDLVSRTMEKSILSELPPETEIGSNGETAGQLLEAANARHEETGEFMKQADRFESIRAEASDAVISEYTDRHLLHGERAAMQWLLEQAPPQMKSP